MSLSFFRKNLRGRLGAPLVLAGCVLLAGCKKNKPQGEPSPGEEIEESLDCEVAEELVEAARVCSADDQCPCGTHCEFGLCLATCRTTDDCEEGEACDRFGECRTPTNEAVGTTRPEKSQQGLAWTTPLIRVDGGESRVQVVARESGRVRVAADKMVEIRCEEGGDFESECFIDAKPQGTELAG